MEGGRSEWHWRYAILATAFLLVFAGAAPLAYLVWNSSANRISPLSMTLPLAPGEYASAPFVTWLNQEHQIQIDRLPADRSPFLLDWKIVDEQGKTLSEGSFQDQAGGNSVNLGQYHPRPGSRQRIIVDVLQGHAPTEAKLNIGVPEEGLAQGYALPLEGLWCVVLAGSGAILLVGYFLYWVRTAIVRKTQPDTTSAP